MAHRCFLAVFLVIGLAGCARTIDLPRGDEAKLLFPAAQPAEVAPRQYRIGPLDVIQVNVFQEPDLTLKDVQVDAGGDILLPLIGSVHAANLTTSELAKDVADKLRAQYLENPQVSIIVTSSVSQKVVVTGSVTEAGVYEIKGRTTLLEVIAMGKGPTRVAALNQVVVLRTVAGERMGAVFDIRKIQDGKSDDPEILGNDVIVVGFSNLKGAWRDLLITAPLLALFRRF
jgi:polysaccharide export outer membrane protein